MVGAERLAAISISEGDTLSALTRNQFPAVEKILQFQLFRLDCGKAFHNLRMGSNKRTYTNQYSNRYVDRQFCVKNQLVKTFNLLHGLSRLWRN